MSKHLESEYKNFINDQIPNLWDRIEAGLGEQDPAGTNAAFFSTVSMNRTPGAAQSSSGTQPEPSFKKQPEIKTASQRRSRKPFIGIAAAAACVCIVVPFALSVGGGRSAASYETLTAEAAMEEAAAADSAAYESAAAEAFPEAEEYEEAYEEAAAEDTDMSEPTMGAQAKALYEEDDTASENELREEAPAEFAPEEAGDAGAAESAAGSSEAGYAAAAVRDEAESVEETAEETEDAYEEAAEAPVYDTDAVLRHVTYKVLSVTVTSVTAEILTCPGDPSLESRSVTIIRAGAEDPADGNSGTGDSADAGGSADGSTGAENVTTPELPKEPGIYTGSLLPAGEAEPMIFYLIS